VQRQVQKPRYEIVSRFAVPRGKGFSLASEWLGANGLNGSSDLRLERLAEHLRDGELLAVRDLPSRHANLDRDKTYVISVTVERWQKLRDRRSKFHKCLDLLPTEPERDNSKHAERTVNEPPAEWDSANAAHHQRKRNDEH
jgi:hypothetical protein